MKIRLLGVAIIGTIIGYWLVNLFIIEMSFIKYFGIELIITFMHELYNYAKKSELLKYYKSR
jgi:hypothetical protein